MSAVSMRSSTRTFSSRRCSSPTLFRAVLEDSSVHRAPAPLDSQSIVLPDQKDVVFYAVTLNAREEWDARLVTGNVRHLPRVLCHRRGACAQPGGRIA